MAEKEGLSLGWRSLPEHQALHLSVYWAFTLHETRMGAEPPGKPGAGCLLLGACLYTPYSGLSNLLGGFACGGDGIRTGSESGDSES